MAVVTMRQLLDSGVHFGHQTSRWNPKMKRFIFTERNGIYIIDLQQSLAMIDNAYTFVRDTVAHGGTVLFVGTKRQGQEQIAEQAARVGMPYVNERWLGGMLTNFQTVSKRVTRLKELELVDFDDVAGSGRTKKELLMMRRERDKLSKVLSGIRDMPKVPSVVWIVDTNKEHLAVDEARKLGIPVVGILDSNCDPDDVQYGIPGNDDAIRSVGLLTRVIADAVAEGLKIRHTPKAGDDAEATGEAEPLAEWEQELLDGKKDDAKTDDAKDEAPAADAKADDAATEAPAAEQKAADEKPAAKKAAPKKAAAKKDDADEAKADKPAAKKPAPKKPAAKPAADAAATTDEK
ncbi:30S ribosomal protein S2 [Demequina aurantiaca]|uniref:30S ribosomal protein S2 n=1 Tax=Demequina aurantiaca TaxID=676200 RepID=UPI0007815D2B|nr:30S ribosomal protein S2 [Demequina aurantiaca]